MRELAGALIAHVGLGTIQVTRSAEPEGVLAIAEVWRPWRTWVTVLLRAAGGRVLARS